MFIVLDQTQLVEPSFTEAAQKLDSERGIKVVYGMVRGQDMEDGDQDEDGLLQENPTLVLMEFARLMGFRPIDLLATFDKDKSNSLDKEEIKMGLKVGYRHLDKKEIKMGLKVGYRYLDKKEIKMGLKVGYRRRHLIYRSIGLQGRL
jgi:hypothetical protein